jgi:hypothetical protein
MRVESVHFAHGEVLLGIFSRAMRRGRAQI